jgi:hypothetical protein
MKCRLRPKGSRDVEGKQRYDYRLQQLLPLHLFVDKTINIGWHTSIGPGAFQFQEVALKEVRGVLCLPLEGNQ